MLSKRKTTDYYEWDNGDKSEVISKNEKDFLEMLEHVYKFNSSMISEPPTINYILDGQKRFYLPDFFIPSMNLIIEIKASNNGYQKNNKEKEKAKEVYTKRNGFNFIQINDTNYRDFHLFFIEWINQ